jgi:protein-disulfide isomerase
MSFLTTSLPRVIAGFAALALIASLSLGASAFAGDKAATTTLTKAEIEKIVHDYILENGNVLLDSVNNFQRRSTQEKSAEGIKSNHEALFKSDTSPAMGNPKGDITLVEFFDYNCGYCKRVLPTVQKLIDEDKNIRVVFKEVPSLGPTSETAARWALAAHTQGKYFDFHTRMMEHSGQIDTDVLRGIAKDSGLDVDKAAKDADSTDVTVQIEKNRALGADIGVTGTPAFLINEEFVPGAVPSEQLKADIARIRAEKKKN